MGDWRSFPADICCYDSLVVPYSQAVQSRANKKYTEIWQVFFSKRGSGSKENVKGIGERYWTKESNFFLFPFSATLHLGDTPAMCWRTEDRQADFSSQRK